MLRADERFWNSPRACVLSSHRGRGGASCGPWWDAFRDTLQELAATDHLVLTVAGTPTDRWLRVAAARFNLPLAELRMPRPRLEIDAWWQERRDEVREEAALTPGILVCDVSPPLPGARSCLPTAGSFPCDPGYDRRDALLLSLADRSQVIFVREGGRIARLLEEMASGAEFGLAGVFLDEREELVGRASSVRWQASGAARTVRRGVTTPVVASVTRPANGLDDWATSTAVGRLAKPVIVPWADVRDEMSEYLNHWTRACPGPWPGQSDEEFLMEMMFDVRARRRSALDSLLRIVREGRLRASGRLVRGGTPAVSFTARSLGEFASLRRYRRHLGRWDFNSFGICLHRDWLRQLGSRPVMYGDQGLWEQLPAEQRPFFQRGRVKASAVVGGDWEVEAEWRHLGDIDLTQAPVDAVRLFVGDARSAEELAAVCRWTIVVLEEVPGGVAAGESKRRPRG